MNNRYGRSRDNKHRNLETRRPSERYDRENYYRNSNPDHWRASDEESSFHFSGKFEDKNDPTYDYNYGNRSSRGEYPTYQGSGSYGTRERDMMRESNSYDPTFRNRHPDYSYARGYDRNDRARDFNRSSGAPSGYEDENYYGNDGDFSSLRGRSYDQGYSRSQYGYSSQDRSSDLTWPSCDTARHSVDQNTDFKSYRGSHAMESQRQGSLQNSSYSDMNDYSGRGPKGWKRSDESIKESICQTLEQHPRIDASEIEVEVNDGIATLKGHIHDRPTKRLAEDLVSWSPGVQDVHNLLSVDKSFFEKAKDFLTGESDMGAADTKSKSSKLERNPRH